MGPRGSGKFYCDPTKILPGRGRVHEVDNSDRISGKTWLKCSAKDRIKSFIKKISYMILGLKCAKNKNSDIAWVSFTTSNAQQ